MVRKWLITGGCGFIGRSLIRQLIDEGGHQICVVDNLSVGSREDLGEVCQFQEIRPGESSGNPSTVQLLIADILDPDTAIQTAKNMDVIVHLAANTGITASVQNPRKDCMSNVIGTMNYLETARINRIKRFVFASSGAPVGECEPPIHEEMVPHPVSPYGASKLAAEGYCSAYYHSFGVETVALRFGNVYGPLSSNKTSVIAKFIKRALAGKPLEIYGDGSQTRDFIYITDLVSAIRRAASAEGIGGEIFQIATAHETTVSAMTKKLMDGLKIQAGLEDIYTVCTPERLGDVKRNFSDTRKALNRLGWQASVGLDEGLRGTVTWFLKNRERFLA